MKRVYLVVIVSLSPKAYKGDNSISVKDVVSNSDEMTTENTRSTFNIVYFSFRRKISNMK